MTTYPFPAATPAPPTAASVDPTAVMGRRIGAFVIDLLLFLLVAAFVGPTPLSPLAEYFDEPDTLSCDTLYDSDDDVAGCTEIGDRVYFTTTGDVPIQIGAWLAFVGLYAALQATTGRTPGKAVFGLKVVNEQGGNPNFGRSLGRTLLWIVDGQPCGIPLVGFITGLTTKGHRRVGDMAAKTFVVGKAHRGPVLVPGLTTAAGSPYGGPGAPGAPWGGPPPGASGPPSWGAPVPPQAPWGAPPAGFPPPGAAGPPSGATPAGAPTTPPTHMAPRPAPPSSTPAGGGEARPGPPAGVPGGPPARETSATAPTEEPPRATPAGAPTVQAPADEGTAPVSAPSTAATPAPPATTPAPQPAPQPSPAAQPTPSAQPASQQPAAQPAATGYNPQWDAARGTYIVWEPQRGQWLGWDDSTKQWRPL